MGQPSSVIINVAFIISNSWMINNRQVIVLSTIAVDLAWRSESVAQSSVMANNSTMS